MGLVKYKFENENAIHNITVEEGEILLLVGDIHGQFEDLVRIFEQNGFPSESPSSSGANKFIFNGDLVDRGPNSIECVLTLFLMKVCAPHNIFITRGNHESHTCGDGSFKVECFNKSWEPLKFFETCHAVFDVLPLGYIINEKVFVSVQQFYLFCFYDLLVCRSVMEDYLINLMLNQFVMLRNRITPRYNEQFV